MKNNKNNHNRRRGFTLVELLLAALISSILIFAVAVVVSDSQRVWHQSYNHLYADVVTEAHVAQRTFDTLVRRATPQHVFTDPAGNWVEVHYYQSAASTDLDRFAKFYASGQNLYVDHGILNPKTISNTDTLAQNVASCTFDHSGRAVQMHLQLDNNQEDITVLTSAVAHN